MAVSKIGSLIKQPVPKLAFVHSEDPQIRAYGLATAAFLATALCIIIPRIGPLLVTGSAIAVFLFQTIHAVARKTRPKAVPSIFLRPEVLFGLWVCVACLWSVEIGEAIPKALFLVAMIASALYWGRTFQEAAGRDVQPLARGLLAGFLLAGFYVGVDTFTRSSLAEFVLFYFPELSRGLTKHIIIRNGVVEGLSAAHITRVSAVYCLLLGPAALAATLYTEGALKWVCYALLAALSIVVFNYSVSQTAQFALVVAVCVLLSAFFLPTLTRWALALGFVLLLVMFVPVSTALYNAKVHEDPDVFKSARARIIIWNYTAQKILERPLFGVGTNSTRYLDERRPAAEKVRSKDMIVAAATRAHPHNIYLQIWYELGIVGVGAFGVLGLSLLGRVPRLPRIAVPFALAHFAICMTVIAPSYGLWQNWFQSALATSGLAFVLVAQRRGHGREDVPPESLSTPVA